MLIFCIPACTGTCGWNVLNTKSVFVSCDATCMFLLAGKRRVLCLYVCRRQLRRDELIIGGKCVWVRVLRKGHKEAGDIPSAVLSIVA